jgi:hypothetical protein
VDEINKDKHMNMNFTEFIEAICRIADKLSIHHLIDDTDLTEEDILDTYYTDQWFKRPLHYKIESFLLMLAKNCLGEKYYNETAVPSLLKLREKHDIFANDIEVPGKIGKVLIAKLKK